MGQKILVASSDRRGCRTDRNRWKPINEAILKVDLSIYVDKPY
jgi:hypothetical protein